MLKVKNLKKSYKKHLVLKDVNFEIKKKEIMALIGVNGSGKSTLVELLCGIKSFDDGEIIVSGINVLDKKKKRTLNNIIGYMPQVFTMFNDLTVYENLGYVCSIFDIDDSKIDEVVELCYLTDYKNTLAKNLSGGFKQLLSLATVIIHSPDIFILDEPTSAMDPIFRKKFWKIIKSCNKKGATILLITHYIEELLECDSFMCLSGGEIKYSGSVKDFKDKGFINIEQILNKYN